VNLAEILFLVTPAGIALSLLMGLGLGLVLSRVPPMRYGDLGVFSISMVLPGSLFFLALTVERTLDSASPYPVGIRTIGTGLLWGVYALGSILGMVVGRRLR
jgi:hypothetical protein